MDRTKMDFGYEGSERTSGEALRDVRMSCLGLGWGSAVLALVIWLVGWAIYGMHSLAEMEVGDLYMTLATVFLLGLSFGFGKAARWLKSA